MDLPSSPHQKLQDQAIEFDMVCVLVHRGKKTSSLGILHGVKDNTSAQGSFPYPSLLRAGLDVVGWCDGQVAGIVPKKGRHISSPWDDDKGVRG